VIVDTGVLYAAMAPSDRNHAACAKLLQATRELLLPALVLVELDYFLSQLTGSHRPFDEVLRRIENGVFTVLDLAVGDYSRVRDLCAQYGDWPLGFVDAAVVTLASGSVRLGLRRSTAAMWRLQEPMSGGVLHKGQVRCPPALSVREQPQPRRDLPPATARPG
jgi:uncharacterized protein